MSRERVTSVYAGLEPAELEQVLAEHDLHRFPPGSDVIVEGESPHALYVIETGVVDVLAADRHGVQHAVGRLGPGSVVGEMSLLTGQAASATVRAVTEIDVRVVDEAAFHRAATAFPRIYRNVAAVLSEKLVAANRRAVRDRIGEVTWLDDRGSPPLLGYALACSLAWHTRRPVLLLVLEDGEAPAVLAELAGREREGPHADLRVERRSGEFAHEVLDSTLDELAARYDHVLVQARARPAPPAPDERAVFLSGRGARPDPGGPVLEAWTAGAAPRPDRAGILRIPELDTGDEVALRAGVLPPRSAAGRALGWAARHVARLKVGVAFGAGGPRGYAHVGAVRALERAGVPIDYASGTSIGSLAAAILASGRGADEIAATMDDVGASTWRLTLPTRSFLSSSGLRSGLRRVFGDARFEGYDLPAGVVAADVVSGREVVLRRGLVWPAVLASISIPGIYPAQRMGPYTLVDGGVVNPVPVDVAADLGADRVIGVKLAKSQTVAPVSEESTECTDIGPGPVQTILRTIEIMQSEIVPADDGVATIAVEVVFEGTELPNLRRFTHGGRFTELGDDAVEAALPRLEAALPWLGSPPTSS